MSNKKNIYFASDFHLGAPNYKSSREREKNIVQWLSSIEKDCAELYLVGDVFDFWFEYKTVVPKGYVRLLGKLAQMVDAGVQLHIFKGNHDMWMRDYFEQELEAKIYSAPIIREIAGKTFFIGHGDGLGPGDHGYKFLKRIFSNSICKWLFARLHPNFGVGLANFWSKTSRAHTGSSEDAYLGDENEYLVQFCLKHSKEHPQIDYYIFGHRHLPLEKRVHSATYINLGEWIQYNTYAVFDSIHMKLLTFHQ